MFNFILASGNSHKAEEFKILLDKKLFNISAAPEKVDVIEDGNTYFENAFKKASTYYSFFKKPVLSDDSGLTVEALPDELGIFSARFGGEGLTDKQRAELLLQRMEEFPEPEQRKAYFSCVLCFMLSEEEVYYFEGRVLGSIGFEYRGNEGFGYDPVFIPEALNDKNLTFAECIDWKQLNSHRARACQEADKFFLQRNCQNQ